MKTLYTVILCLTFSYSFSQSDEYLFLPAWKIGDEKKILIVYEEKEIQNGKVAFNTTTYLKAKILVWHENETQYFVRVHYENIVLQTARMYHPDLEKELEDYNTLALEYVVDKLTGEPELTNWKAVQSFVNESMRKVLSIFNRDAPDMIPFIELAFRPIEEIFKSRENIDAYITDQVDYIFLPYGKKFNPGSSLIINQTCPNPLKSSQLVSQTSSFTISNIDVAQNQCDINVNEVCDLGDYEQSVMARIQTVEQAATATENQVDFEVTGTTTIKYDYNSTWPVKVVRIGHVMSKYPLQFTEKTMITTALIE